MKQYLNSLWLAPVLGLLIPFVISLIITGGDINSNYFGLGNIFLLGFLGIGLLNIWNYNIIDQDNGNTYKVNMLVFISLISFFFCSMLMSKNSDYGFGFLILFMIYIIGFLYLFILNYSYRIKKLPITNEQLPITTKKTFFTWVNFPLFICVGIFLKYTFLSYLLKPNLINLYVISGVLLTRYCIVFIINKKLLSNNIAYRVIMILIVLFITFGLIPKLYMSMIIEQRMIIYLLISLLLLIITCAISNKLYKKDLLQIK